MGKIKEKLSEANSKIDWFDVFEPFLIILAVSLFLFGIYKDLTKTVKLLKRLGQRFKDDTEITPAE